MTIPRIPMFHDPSTLIIPNWYLPSFHGDIRLVATGTDTTDLVMERLTKEEEKAIVALSAIALKKGWSPADPLVPSMNTATLRAPISKVAKQLEKLLRPDRTMISAVVFKNGSMAELRSTPDITLNQLAGAIAPSDSEAPSATSKRDEETVDAEVLPKATAGGGFVKRKKGTAIEDAEKEPDKQAAKAAVSVAAPTRGCPAPDFTSADIRAKRVLREFLEPCQVSDFNRYNKFVSQGQTTGNLYMITSRHARDELAKYTRSLFDLDRQLALCVHDWDVPAAEEMLALHVLLQLPGWENYLDISEDNMEEVLARFVGKDRELQRPMLAHELELTTRPLHATNLTVQWAAARNLV